MLKCFNFAPKFPPKWAFLTPILYFCTKIGESPRKLTHKFLIFLCLFKSSTCLKSENEIKFANVSHDFDLFGKMLLCSPVFAHVRHDAIFLFTISIRK